MRILYFLAHPHGIGGAANVLIKQAHLMQKDGHVVKMIIQDDENDKHSDTFDKVCDEYKLERKSCSYTIAVCIEDIDILKSLDDVRVVYGIIKSFGPDLIHSIQINTTVELIARETMIPHIMSVYPVSKGMFNIPWMNIFPRFHMADSEFYCKQWREGLGITSKCVRISYCKRSISEKNKDQTNSDKIYIICIGVLTYNKNQLEILKFIKKCKEINQKVHLSILGDDRNEYGDICKKYVMDNDISDIVDFCGVVIGVEEYLKESDVLIHASRTESYPGVMVEAIANRIPVLVTPVGGISETMTNEENCLFIDGFEATDIFDAFTRFIKHRETGELQSIIDKAYKTYLNNHLESIAEVSLRDYYESMLADINGLKHCNETALSIENTFKSYRGIVNKYDDAYIISHIWFAHHINKQIKRFGYKTAKIWGAGKYGRIAQIFCKDFLDIELIGVLDKYKNGQIQGYKIDKPTKDNIKEADILVVAIADMCICSEIGQYLEKSGRVRNKDYYFLLNDPCMVL